MKWRVRAGHSRAKERANISFFIFVMFFAVFGVIILTELLLPEQHHTPGAARFHYDDAQSWESRTETNGDGIESPPPPAREPLDAVWQPVTGTRFRFLVYSAFVERRTVTAIRIIAATKTRWPDAVECRIWLPNNRTITTRTKVQAIRENWNMKYSATYVLCLLRDTGVKPHEAVGASVAVIAKAAPHRPPTNLLTILDTEPKDSPAFDNTIHVCVKPFYYSYGRKEWMVEWFELQRLLGVSHFYMYNASLSEATGCLIEHYRQKGLVTLLQWKLPLISQVEIRTQGLFATFNDCLYRSMSKAGWLAVIDVDEVLFPHREHNLQDFLNSFTGSHSPPTRAPSGFIFRNAFFYLRWEDDSTAQFPLLTARKTRRLMNPHGLKYRSKYVIRPRDAVELGNHFLWEHVPSAHSVGVPINRGLLHHYRVNCEFGGTQCLTLPSTIDRTAHNWTRELFSRVTEEKAAIAQSCHSYDERDEKEISNGVY